MSAGAKFRLFDRLTAVALLKQSLVTMFHQQLLKSLYVLRLVLSTDKYRVRGVYHYQVLDPTRAVSFCGEETTHPFALRLRNFPLMALPSSSVFQTS